MAVSASADGPDIAEAVQALKKRLPGFTPGMLRYFALNTRISSADGTLREGTPEELAAEYAEVSKYVVRPRPVPEFVDDGFLSADWNPSDGVGPFLKSPKTAEPPLAEGGLPPLTTPLRLFAVPAPLDQPQDDEFEPPPEFMASLRIASGRGRP